MGYNFKVFKLFIFDLVHTLKPVLLVQTSLTLVNYLAQTSNLGVFSQGLANGAGALFF